MPDTASVIFGAGDYEEIVTRDTYLREINEADSALARRVGETRDAGPSPGGRGRRGAGQGGRLRRTGRGGARRNRRGARSGGGLGGAPGGSQRRPRSLAGAAERRHRHLGRRREEDPRRAEAKRAPRSRRKRRGSERVGRRRSRPLARRPVLDPDLHRDVRVGRQLQRRSTPRAAPAAPTRSSPRPGNSTAAKANPRTPRKPNRTASPPKSGPTPAPAPGSAAPCSWRLRGPPGRSKVRHVRHASVRPEC